MRLKQYHPEPNLASDLAISDFEEEDKEIYKMVADMLEAPMKELCFHYTVDNSCGCGLPENAFDDISWNLMTTNDQYDLHCGFLDGQLVVRLLNFGAFYPEAAYPEYLWVN